VEVWPSNNIYIDPKVNKQVKKSKKFTSQIHEQGQYAYQIFVRINTRHVVTTSA
jgi:hypothetical protein